LFEAVPEVARIGYGKAHGPKLRTSVLSGLGANEIHAEAALLNQLAQDGMGYASSDT
jgi:hypothetical protein